MIQPLVTCLHHLFEQQAARSPQATALEFADGTMSYGELDARASRLAAVLRERGVRTETLVGMACERSPHLLVALLGIMKSGGAYVPLDLDAPAARLTDVLEQCAKPLVVTTTESRRRIPLVTEDDIVYVDRMSSRQPTLHEPAQVHAGNLVYVIFTSGSTGQPKGVLTEHAPVVNRLRWMMRNHALSPADKVLQKTPVIFDVSVWEMFWPLSVGATLVIAPPGEHRNTDYLVRAIVAAGITVAHFVPSMLHGFIEHPQVTQCTSLTRVFCSGEALTPALQERFFARLHGSLHNLYGPTEAAIEVSHWVCVPGSATVPIGYPIDNVRLYVLDEWQRPVPDGEPGELVIAGLPVARGYLGRPDLSAHVFLNDPYGPPGERMYRSGDRVLRRGDGALEYLGRLDDQVKLRGQRIELGEVEAGLQSHPWVSRAVVALKSRGETDQRLVGYVVLGSPAEMNELEAALRSHLSDRLPGYMIPSAFVIVDRIPLSPAGKVDRQALPDPLLARQGGQEASRSPAEAAQRRLDTSPDLAARVAVSWADVLHRDAGGPESFLDSGGNSLLAAILAARITHELGTPVTVAQVLAAGSLPELTDAVAAAHTAGAACAAGTDPGFPVARSLDELRLEQIATMPEAEIDELLAELDRRE
jgi:amino acid adenylation domain-containing protein